MKQIAFMPFVKAVFEIDLPKFKELLEEFELDQDLLVDIRLCPGQHIPIYWLTQCWEKIIEDAEIWRVEVREQIIKKKADNKEIKKIFIERFGVEFTPIDFYNLSDLAVPFFRDAKDDTDEDVLYDDINELIKQGYREIDLQLYCAVCRFDYDRVEELLKMGANPKLETADYDCMDRIGGECSYLSLGLVPILLKENGFGKEDYAKWLETINLIGWAAHETMYSLLKNTTIRHIN